MAREHYIQDDFTHDLYIPDSCARGAVNRLFMDDAESMRTRFQKKLEWWREQDKKARKSKKKLPLAQKYTKL